MLLLQFFLLPPGTTRIRNEKTRDRFSGAADFWTDRVPSALGCKRLAEWSSERLRRQRETHQLQQLMKRRRLRSINATSSEVGRSRLHDNASLTPPVRECNFLQRQAPEKSIYAIEDDDQRVHRTANEPRVTTRVLATRAGQDDRLSWINWPSSIMASTNHCYGNNNKRVLYVCACVWSNRNQDDKKRFWKQKSIAATTAAGARGYRFGRAFSPLPIWVPPTASEWSMKLGVKQNATRQK